jgi:hypothetical protein
MNVMCLYLQARSMVPLSFTHQDLHIAPSFFSMNYPVFASSCEHGIYYTLTQFAWCRDVEIAWQMEPSPSYLLLSKEMFQLRCRRWPLITYFYLWVKLILKKKIIKPFTEHFGKHAELLLVISAFQTTNEMVLSLIHLFFCFQSCSCYVEFATYTLAFYWLSIIRNL